MLNFTARGAVRTPTSLQIRIGGSAEPGALRAGAPAPSRALRPVEITANLRHFTEGLRTTRTRPCTRLTLSGVGAIDVDVEGARRLGFDHIVVHGQAPASVLDAVDRIVIRVRHPEDLASWTEDRPLSITIPVDPALPRDLPGWIDRVIRRRPTRVVFWWPFPGGGATQPTAPDLVQELEDAITTIRAEGIETLLGGLPQCLLGAWARPSRTTNRYYVDADHQLDAALLFFPDIVEMARPDTCRACALTARCDGVARRWLDGGGLGVLQPIALEPGER